MLFDRSNKYIDSRPEYTKQQYTSLELENNPGLNLGYALLKLEKELDIMPDNELFGIIRSCYQNLLADIFNNGTKTIPYLEIVTNKRFLSAFVQVLQCENLTPKIRLFCNKLSYDYITSGHDEKNIKDLFLKLSQTVNKEVIAPLIAIGLTHEIAAYFALCRYSSSNEKVNIMRLNHMMISCEAHLIEPDLMTEQNIIYIYEKMFNKFSHIFKYTMFDVYTKDDLYNIGPCADEIYSNISLAIIDMLNSLTSQQIRNCLVDYNNEYTASVKTLQYRFSIQTLAVCDYNRILDVVEYLKNGEGIIIL